jgi:hypothetical protein
VTPALIGSLLFIALAVLCAGFSDRVHRALWRKTPARLREGTDPIARGVQSLHVGLTLLGERKARIVLLLGLALLFQLSGLGGYYLMCRALEIPVSPAGLAAVLPLMGLANLFPSILGIGARDAGFVLALQQVQIQPADAVTLSVLHLALILYSAAIGAALLFFRRARLHPEMDSE